MLQIFTRELHIFFSFSWRDWSASIIPASIFAFGGIRGLSLPSVIYNYLLVLTWLTSYLYFHCLFNQIVGAAEDKINKPDRPIPSGMVSLHGAKIRFMITLPVLLIISIYEPAIFLETLTWICTDTFLCTTSGGNHWFGKNTIAMATGAWALLSASRKLMAPHTPRSEAQVNALSLWVGVISQVQDLRDAEGDALIGRKTMPIVLGDWNTRLIISFVLIPTSVCVLHLGNILDGAPWTLTVLHIILAYRVLQTRGPRYDHKTYMFVTYIFCTKVAISAWLS